jgi:ubiquinone/menaquinone biosynthesis C-methylase UbiE
MSRHAPPPWWLPEGVNASLWEYAHTSRLAEEEEEYFRGHPLLEADGRLLDARFVEPGPLVDLGCGAGRLALRFAGRGFNVVALDLSRPMLRTVAIKAQARGLKLDRLAGNLCRLPLASEAFRYAISMFSTLGMIRSAPARKQALAETFRVLKPGGRLALHAHNLFLNLAHSQGQLWLLRQAWRALRGLPDVGDRRMTYRGIANMEVHLYTWPELRTALQTAGFLIDEVISLEAARALPVGEGWLARNLRAGGWIVLARRPG